MRRELIGELMDDPAIDAADHRQALRGLRRLNRWSDASKLLWRELRDLRPGAGPIILLDLACGSGDLAIELARRAAGEKWRLLALDRSATALQAAREAADHARIAMETRIADVLRDDLPAADVATCNLFLHHLEWEQAVALLRRMAAAARRRVVVSDLCRSATTLALVAIASRLATLSRVVHVDAVRSARAAFTVDEARRLAGEAGLAGARVQRRFPGRWVLVWNKSHADGQAIQADNV